MFEDRATSSLDQDRVEVDVSARKNCRVALSRPETGGGLTVDGRGRAARDDSAMARASQHQPDEYVPRGVTRRRRRRNASVRRADRAREAVATNCHKRKHQRAPTDRIEQRRARKCSTKHDRSLTGYGRDVTGGQGAASSNLAIPTNSPHQSI